MERNPERFSNNVVTRPLMQEYVFPTLAFIGGPGELAYWSELQQVFHTVGFRMPPVVPRITISYLERDIATDVKDLQLQESDPFVKNVDKLRENWLSNQIEEPIDERFVGAKRNNGYSRIITAVCEEDRSRIKCICRKNELKINEQIELLERMLKKC